MLRCTSAESFIIAWLSSGISLVTMSCMRAETLVFAVSYSLMFVTHMSDAGIANPDMEPPFHRIGDSTTLYVLSFGSAPYRVTSALFPMLITMPYHASFLTCVRRSTTVSSSPHVIDTNLPLISRISIPSTPLPFSNV